MAENGGDLVTSWTLDVHEEGVWVLDKPLQLALANLLLGQGVQQVLGQRHLDCLKWFLALFTLASRSDILQQRGNTFQAGC